MVERVVRVSRRDKNLGRLFQLTSGAILTEQELLRAIAEGKVAGAAVKQSDGGVDLVGDDDDDTLDLLSPISEDDLQAYRQQRTNKAAAWDGLDGDRLEPM